MNNKLIRNSIGIFLFVIIVLITIYYSYYQTKAYLQGPIIELTTPINGSSQYDNIIYVTGYTKNISYISLNDKQIYVNLDGKIKEKLILSPGYNMIKVSAQDKYDRKIEKEIEVVLLINN
ncbi:MAG: hypothetical protein KAR54_00245 [Candidatus Pacebacteria bacterium]|nr:hypothetical protein [Candidatus Paceibacterota bacterium]